MKLTGTIYSTSYRPTMLSSSGITQVVKIWSNTKRLLTGKQLRIGGPGIMRIGGITTKAIRTLRCSFIAGSFRNISTTLNQMESFFTGLSAFLGSLLACLVSPMLYQLYFDVVDLGTVIFFPFAVVLFFILLGTASLATIRSWAYPFIGVGVFLGLTIVFTPLSILHKTVLDSPRVVLAASFYNESGFDLFLRADMTVKCTEIDIFTHVEKYGTYQVLGDTIILKDIDIEYGLSEVQDTLLLSGDYLIFHLDREWRRILEGQMDIDKNTLR
jgi:hypothetical protein